MRALIFLPLALSACPALAQPAKADPAAEITRQVNDSRTVDRLSGVMQSLSHALLELKVGELQAAVEGRPATAADRRLTVRDLGRRDDPNFDRRLTEQMAQVRPMVGHALKALGEVLPPMIRSFEEAGRSIERAAANMPDPTYPKR